MSEAESHEQRGGDASGRESWETVRRVDVASEVGARKTPPHGVGISVEANLTRTGVFKYQQPDGTVRRELRHPDEVFSPESLKTLHHATVTDGHPSKVTVDNWKAETIGQVGTPPHKNGRFVQSDLHLLHGDAIQKAEKRDLCEASCAYDCRIDPTPGVHEGEPYDVIQRDIRYNHVALGPRGWGRAGPEVKMHLDGGVGVGIEEDAGRYVRGMADKTPEQLRLDALERDLQTSRDEVKKLTGEKDTLQGRVDSFERDKTAATTTQQNQDAARRLDADISQRMEMFLEARSWLGPEWSWKRADGGLKTTGEVRRELVKHFDSDAVLEGRSDEYIAGVCSTEIRKAERARGSLGNLADASSHLDMVTAGGARRRGDSRELAPRSDARGPRRMTDEEEEAQDSKVKEAQDAMTAKACDAWKAGKRDKRRGDNGGRGEIPSRGAFGGGNAGSGEGALGGTGY